MTQDMKQNMLGWAKKSEKKVRELWKVLKNIFKYLKNED